MEEMMNNVELNETEQIEAMDDIQTEEGESSVKSGLILGAIGLGLVGLGYGIKAGVDKIKTKRAEKKSANAEDAPKEKKGFFSRFKKSKEEPKKEYVKEAPKEEAKAEEKEES